MITLRSAERSEAAVLSDLCLRAKAVWGYDAAFLADCAEELSISPERMNAETLQVAELGGELAGVVEITLRRPQGTVEKLFVEPAHMEKGVGRCLLNWAKDQARGFGIRTLVVEADPGAARFYWRMGGVADGFVPSGSIPGRILPRFRLDLTEPAS